MDIRASLRQGEDGRWSASTSGEPSLHAEGRTREQCMEALRRTLAESQDANDGPADVSLIVEVVPRLAGVAEAARIIGWDKRRVVTYIDRGRFPEPLQSLAGGRVWLRDDVERYAQEWHARRATRRPRPQGPPGADPSS